MEPGMAQSGSRARVALRCARRFVLRDVPLSTQPDHA